MKRTSSGFSAIEALIAVAIVAVALVPLLDLQRQVLIAHERQTALYEEAAAIENALVLLRDLNPSATRSGTLRLGDGAVSWTSSLMGVVRATRRSDANGQTYLVGRYRVEVLATSSDGAQRRLVTLEKLGWQPLSQPARATME
jgi:type II secretory pathway component PulJ